MQNLDYIVSQIRQRLEILCQQVYEIDPHGGGGTPPSEDVYTKEQADAKFVQKIAGKGLSTNDFTNEYLNKINTNTTNIGVLDSAIDSLFTPSSISVSEGSYLDADTLALVALHQPIRLNGKQFYFLGGDQSVVDYFAIDNNGNFVAYFARIQLSNGQVLILTSFIGSDQPVEDGEDLFTTGGAYLLQGALETLISYKAELDDVYGYGMNISNVDLDDYKTIGRYYTQNSTQSGTLNNCPYKSAAGNLTVEELCDTNVGTIIQQTWKVNSSDAQTQTYIRKWRGSSNGWSDWFRIPCAYDDFQMSTISLGAADTPYATVDLNNLKTPGVYRCTSSNALDTKIAHKPTADNIQFVLTIRGTYNTTSFRQELMPVDSANADKIYVRNCVGGTWTGWYVFTGTSV